MIIIMQSYVWIIFLTIIAYIVWFNILEKLMDGVYDVETLYGRILYEMQENDDTWQVIYEICDICYVNS